MPASRLRTRGGGFTRDAAVREGVAQRVAAHAVRSVDAARHFARGVEPRNHLAVTVDHPGLDVDLDAAHRVVARHADRARIEGSLFDLVRKHARRTAEGILLRVDGLVVFRYRLLELFGGNADLARELFDRLRFKERAVRKSLLVRLTLELVVRGKAHRVGERIDGLCGLRERRVADHVAAGVFGDEALPFLVDEDRVFDHLDEVPLRLVARGRPRNALDVVETDRKRSDVLHGDEDFARGARLVRRGKFGETRVEVAAHFGVVGVTARRRDDALRGAPVFLLPLHFDFDAEDAAFRGIFADEGGHLVAGEDFAFEFLEALQHRLDVGIALLALRIAAARPEAAVDLIDRREGDAELAEPFDRFGHFFGVLGDERRVGAEVARGERLFGMKLRGVFDAGLLRFFHDGAVHAAARLM